MISPINHVNFQTKEPLQSRSGKREHSLTVVIRLAHQSQCFDYVVKLINCVLMFFGRAVKMERIWKILSSYGQVEHPHKIFLPRLLQGIRFIVIISD